MDINKLIKPGVLKLKAYEAKEIPCKVKLDANESPYGFPNPFRIKTNRYPDPEAKTLKKGYIDAFLKGFGLREPNVLIGNGSDELIYYLINVFGGPVLYPAPTFSMYGIIAKALGERAVEIPLDDDFDLDVDSISASIKKDRPKIIFLSSPNNPTGNCFSADRTLKIIGSSRGIVVVDEAYQPFSSNMGFVPLLKDYRNLLIMRTLSKFGLAALRVGLLIGDEEILSEVNKVRLPFNLNALSQGFAVQALMDKKRISRIIKSVVVERERLYGEMSGIEGITVYPSEANFILFKTNDADRVHAALLKKGVLIRDMKGVVDSCLRVTVGTDKENDMFLKVLEAVIRKGV